jgi:hypothetical protein
MTDHEIKLEFIRLSPEGSRLQVKTISWDGQDPTEAWLDYERISKDASPAAVDAAMNKALADERYFSRCQKCQTLNPIGWMNDSGICQSCAEQYLGILY